MRYVMDFVPQYESQFSFRNFHLPLHQASLNFSYEDLDKRLLYFPLSEIFKNIVKKRKIEFHAGRMCSHKALKAIGVHCNTYLPVGESGSPVWPEKMVGSISHTNNYASAVVAKNSDFRSLGFDVESWIDQKRITNIIEYVVTPLELKWMSHSLGKLENQVFTEIFSAKESIMKCFSPLVGRLITFLDMEIIPDNSSSNRFRFRLLKNINHEFEKGYEGMGWKHMDDKRIYTLVSL